MQVAEAYLVCRTIAKREAKNFYYSFVTLPREKCDAICAVYAFMRHADDLADDETLAVGERRRRLLEWVSAWHLAERGGLTSDAVFVALRDAQARFSIPSELLDQLVAGTTMDLQRGESAAEGAYDTYATFEDLYRYCYLVASVVGLVCIRIFGYSDARAEKLAEETGVAFQLTNILRDVKEDAERRRLYLPIEDTVRFGVGVEEIAGVCRGGDGMQLAYRKLLAFEAARAEKYYASGRRLLLLIERNSRPALWVLITIYHRLLRRIVARNYDVFSERVSVPTYEKLAILSWGILRVFANRLLGWR